LSDDNLKKMLEDALAQKANLEEEAKTKLQKLEEDMKASGAELKARVMPRLLAAQAAWAGKLELRIVDESSKLAISGGVVRVRPTITVSTSSKEHASYKFSTHHPGYASIDEGAGPNVGNKAYSFKVEKLSDLTDSLVDQVLQSLMQEALGLKSKR
jgi:Mg-chelatase subunit ChlI